MLLALYLKKTNFEVTWFVRYYLICVIFSFVHFLNSCFKLKQNTCHIEIICRQAHILTIPYGLYYRFSKVYTNERFKFPREHVFSLKFIWKLSSLN